MKQLIIWTIIILLTVSLGHAQDEFATFSPNALATGLGESLVGYTDHPSVIYWNPGALAFTTTDRIMVSSQQPFSINNLCFTKFFPPKHTFGFGLSRITHEEEFIDIATAAYSRRLTRYFSVGGNINYGTIDNKDQDFATIGFGVLLRPALNQESFYRSEPAYSHLFFNPTLYEKFAIGLMVHNLPIGGTNAKHVIRVGAAFKFSQWGPFFHLAYHRMQQQHSAHVGMGFRFSKEFQFTMGSTDMNFKDLAFGGSFHFSKLSADLIYSTRSEKIAFSVGLQLSDSPESHAEKYMAAGIRKIRDLKYRDALFDFEKSLSYNQDNEKIIYLTEALERKIVFENHRVDSLYAQAVIFYQKGWNVSSVLTVKKILAIDRTNPRAIKLLQTLKPFILKHIDNLLDKGIAAFQQHNFVKSKSYFQDILAVNEHHRKAIHYLAKIDSVNSHMSDDYYYRGLGYFQRHHYQKALQAFKRVLELNPNHAEAQLYLDRIHRKQQELKPLINKLLTDAHRSERQGNYQQAIQNYQKILNLNLDHEQATKQLSLLNSYINNIVQRKLRQGRKLMQEHKYQAAQASFLEILAMKPEHTQSLHYLSQIRDIRSEEIESTVNQAQQYFEERRLLDARTACEKALTLDPSHKYANILMKEINQYMDVGNLQNRALQMFQNGNYVGARKLFRQIIEVDPEHIIANSYIKECNAKIKKLIAELFNSGMTFYTSGKFENAIRDWNRILAIEPNHASALEYKRRARERLDALNQLP